MVVVSIQGPQKLVPLFRATAKWPQTLRRKKKGYRPSHAFQAALSHPGVGGLAGPAKGPHLQRSIFLVRNRKGMRRNPRKSPTRKPPVKCLFGGQAQFLTYCTAQVLGGTTPGFDFHHQKQSMTPVRTGNALSPRNVCTPWKKYGGYHGSTNMVKILFMGFIESMKPRSFIQNHVVSSNMGNRNRDGLRTIYRAQPHNEYLLLHEIPRFPLAQFHFSGGDVHMGMKDQSTVSKQGRSQLRATPRGEQKLSLGNSEWLWLFKAGRALKPHISLQKVGSPMR